MDCSKDNPENPKLCDDVKPFFIIFVSMLAMIVPIYSFTEYPNTHKQENKDGRN